MSRVIVKCLPAKASEEELRKIFGFKGTVTDVQLKYGSDGTFRRIAFIGFRGENEAQATVDFYNGTYIHTSKIKVEMCGNIGDSNIPKSKSKHSKLKFAVTVKKKVDAEDGKEKTYSSEMRDLINQYSDDPLFAEFLSVNHVAAVKSLWENDAVFVEGANAIDVSVKDKPWLKAKSSSKDKSNKSTDDNDDKLVPGDKVDIKDTKRLSDLEYLKSKIVNGVLGEGKTSAKQSKVEEYEDKQKAVKLMLQKLAKSKKCDPDLSVVIRGLPCNVKSSEVKAFFSPLVVSKVQHPRGTKNVYFVSFSSLGDRKRALRKHKSILGGHQVKVTACKKRQEIQKDTDNYNMYKQLNEDLVKSAETIAESGSLYIRNLSYDVTQEDVEKHFQAYGPLSEVRLPVNRLCRKPMGFAFVNFLFPEHAVKAYTELDGKFFLGRNLHILPFNGQDLDAQNAVKNAGSSFKTRKEAERKSQSGSSHNWNSLFLGANAIADVISQRYGTSKQGLLSVESDESLAVRMALGETQLVLETRRFLVNEGIELDAFSNPSCERSRLVILVKNLVAKTTEEELCELFTKYGPLGRVVLPPSGITAVVEFKNETEARAAFQGLAYTKFHGLPLYLEWAPLKVFKADAPASSGVGHVGGRSMLKNDQDFAMQLSGQEIQKWDETEECGEEEDDEELESETTLFVKNLNFSTTEESLRTHFEKCGKLQSATVSRKNDLKNPGQLLSLGYGFVQYKRKVDCQKAMRYLQNSVLDDMHLELKISHRATINSQKNNQRRSNKSATTTQTSAKLLVKNVPFEANQKEVLNLFRTFGEVKQVRLPIKMDGTGSHRGFAFVEFVTRQDAKRAFDALCHSTHLIGRRMVLEWAKNEEDVETLRQKTAKRYFAGSASQDGWKKARQKKDVAEHKFFAHDIMESV